MKKQMKALVCKSYGNHEVLEIQQRPVPVLGSGEMLVRVHASGITRADAMMRQGTPKLARLFLGLRKPKKDIIGTGFSGEIVSLGEGVENFKVGDEVFGCTTIKFGANAEYLKISEKAQVLRKPEFLRHEQACVLADGPLTSYHFMKNVGKGMKGEHILIIGASGSLGLSAIEIARNFGMQVTAVCSSANEEFVRSFGAHHVLCYDKVSLDAHRGEYAVIYDTIGAFDYGKSKALLAKGGRYITSVANGRTFLASLGNCRWSGKKAKFSASGLLKSEIQKNMLKEVLQSIKEDKLHVHIERTYRLEEAAEAHQYIDSGRKRGNVVFSLIP